MRIVFSRKGFDSTYGGAPSPIVDGRPVSLPIPGSHGETTTYGALDLAGHATKTTGGKVGAGDPCHDDPMFAQGLCWLGQTGAAQGHLRRQGVSAGDVFLFFGLFAEPDSGERHHRLFGYMRVACHGRPGDMAAQAEWTQPPRPHPHFSGDWGSANAIYHGPGTLAARAVPALRLTVPNGPLNRWRVPPWLGRLGLSYHAKPERWIDETTLDSARRGQEFVCDIGEALEPRQWLDAIIAEIEGSFGP